MTTDKSKKYITGETHVHSGFNKEIRSVTKAFRILEYLSSRSEPCRLTDIARALDIPASTVLRFLLTLIDIGYVSQEPDSDKYFATLKLCGLSEKLTHGFDICDAARPYVKELSAKCGRTICLSVEKNRSVTYEMILFSSDRQSIYPFRRIGQILPYHCTDAGKIFLASKTKRQLKNILSANPLKKYTANTITDPSVLKKELGKIRDSLYANDREEFSSGLSGIAVPIYDYSDHVAAVLGICVLSSQITEKFQDKYLPLLKETANKISICLGASITC